ncbi:MAG: phospholipase D-like domain-containing protein [Candidatus Micrarchaeia archaeon]
MAFSKDEQYSGSQSFKYIDKLINSRDKELLVISPYISNYYVRLLLHKKKNVRIITSESSMSKNSLLCHLSTHSLLGHLKAITYFIVFGIVLLLLNLKVAYTAAFIIAALLFANLIKNAITGFKTNINVKIVKNPFIHEKLYIGKDLAILGSANLTYNGTHRNVEHIEIITDKHKIKELKDHFEEYWAKY